MFLVNDAFFMLVLVLKNNAHFSILAPELIIKTVPRALYSVLLAALFYVWEFFPKHSGRNY
jgi:hypothetical protein